MKVNEIFLSMQGESASTGFPTVFVRFSGCNLRCDYCDTEYSYYEGEEKTPNEVFNKVRDFGYKRVCITGGEPLIQKDMKVLLRLLKEYTVTIETNGSISIKDYEMYEKHSFVMDMKSPTSGCSGVMNFDNLSYLSERDEVKFVVANKEDYNWSKDIFTSHDIKGSTIMSPVFGEGNPKEIVQWILDDKLDIRFQLQMQKYIWEPSKRGV